MAVRKNVFRKQGVLTMKKNSWMRAALLGGVAVVTATSAVAQEEDRTGGRVGSFIVSPEGQVSTAFSDNYLQSPVTPTDSFSVTSAPSLSIESDWSRHALLINLGASLTHYANDSEDNIYNFGGNSQFALDVTRALAIRFSGGFETTGESRGSVNAPLGAEGTTQLYTTSGGIDARYAPGRIRFSPFVNYQRVDYEDTDLNGGGERDNGDREYYTIGYGLEIGYEYLQGYELFVRGAGGFVEYEDDFGITGPGRSNTSFSVLAGVNFRVTSLIEGRAGVGFVRRDYDAGIYGTEQGVSIDVGLVWSATRLLTVNIDGFQRFDETIVAGASSENIIGFQLSADYRVTERVTLRPSVGYEHSSFDGTSRDEDRFLAGFGAGYRINDHFELGADYSFTYENSSAQGADWSENRFSVGLTARY